MVLSREHRLRGRFVFDRLYQKGQRHHGKLMVLRSLPAQPELLKPDPRDPNPLSCRLGVVVSNKVSKRSVRRNQLRRLLTWAAQRHRAIHARSGDGALAADLPQTRQR